MATATKEELKKAYHALIMDHQVLTKNFNEKSTQLREAELALRSLKSTVEENASLRREVKSQTDKIEKLYAKLIETNESVGERIALVKYWHDKARAYQADALVRGSIRMKYDQPYAIWRDSVMERIATGRYDDPIDMNVLAEKLKKLCGGQLPNGSTDFFAAMLNISQEFGYVTNGRHMAVPKKLQEKAFEEKRQLSMSENFKKVYDGVENDILQDLHEKSVLEIIEAEDKRALEGIQALCSNLDPEKLPEEVAFEPVITLSKRLSDLKGVRFHHVRTLALMIYKKKNGQPLLTYPETLERELTYRRVIDFEMAMGWVVED
jgi:L-fucose mutarotase/ribose pyranase (RbsD/FucU family)